MAESIADRTDPCSSPSALPTEDFSSDLASSLANRLNTDDAILLCAFERRRKGVDVVMERGLEMKEVDGEEAARKAARRMRCL